MASLEEVCESSDLEKEDNGIGFDVNEAIKKERHFGLSVVKERVLFLGGELNINTHNGTSIMIRIPKTGIS